MNHNISALHEIALKEKRFVIGLMSGTSLDGLDIAFCMIEGSGLDTKVDILAFATTEYTEETKNKIREVFAKDKVDFPYLAMLNEWIGILHAGMINDFLKKHNIDKSAVDVIASHGQTVMHVPRHQHNRAEFPNATLQIGDGDHIAFNTGIITISDFRQKHLAAGGQGAPLAVYGDYLIFNNMDEDRIMLNMGGIGNFTYLPASGDPSQVFVTDTGPGNTMMDAFMKNFYNVAYDADAQIAAKGNVNRNLLEALKDHYFFKLDFPKTTGPEVFNLEYLNEAMNKSKQNNISQEDIMATLNRFSAETISEAIRAITGTSSFHIYMSGGGTHNPLLVRSMQQLLPFCTFKKSKVLGIAGDAKEAVLFAVLANETIVGKPINFGKRQGIPSICMGKISFPD